ncbi:MAG: MnhB domain-containing protein [bacterium]
MKRRTDVLDVTGRKLAPYMFLFGLYLVSFGDISPGGGFQGGVVIASGIILLAMTKGVDTTETLFPVNRLSLTETLAFLLLLTAGALGMLLAGGFLADFISGPTRAFTIPQGPILPRVRFIFLLNLLIGVKVGAGVSLICLHLFREE